MRKKILIGSGILAAIMVVFLIVVALQPADFRIARSAKMSASPATVFDQVNDLKAFQVWSPWAKLDPNMQTTFDGPLSGTGAISKWSGNEEVGKGQMTIMESQPPEVIRMKVEFIEPFAATNDTEFAFKPVGDQTEVTWVMTGHHDFIGKMICMFMDMDKMIGADFEKGLTQLKALVESKAPATESTSEPATEAAADATKVE